MWGTENGFQRGSAVWMNLEGWTGVCWVSAEEFLNNLHEYSYISLTDKQVSLTDPPNGQWLLVNYVVSTSRKKAVHFWSSKWSFFALFPYWVYFELYLQCRNVPEFSSFSPAMLLPSKVPQNYRGTIDCFQGD